MRPARSLLATAALWALGCAGELSADEQAFLALVNDGGAASDAPELIGTCHDITVIFEQSCTSGICHDAEEPAAGLDLASPAPETRLVGVPSSCDQLPLIDAVAPEQSYLLEKLGTVTPRCGSSMPLGGELSSGELACVGQWARSLAMSSDGGQP